MNYVLISACGWKSTTYTQEEAIALAEKHHQDWIDAGAPKRVHVKVYYRDGSCVYDTAHCKA
jgi:hypothetical protein